MFDPILERIFSYKKVAKDLFFRYLSILYSIFKNFNNYIYIFSKRLSYSFEFKKQCYYIGKYLSEINQNKYDMSSDKTFIDLMGDLRKKKDLIDRNNKEFSMLKEKDKASKF